MGGDFNPPNQEDYPAEEWAAIAADMTRANLPLTDGVRAELRRAGFLPSFELPVEPSLAARGGGGESSEGGTSAPTRPPLPATTAWNGAVVDYLFAQQSSSDRPPPTALEHEATYVHHTSVSDHLPLVVDFRISK